MKGPPTMPPLRLRPAMITRELFCGDVLASPFAAPHLIAYGEDEEEALIEHELFLSRHLEEIDAAHLAPFVLPEGARLVEVEVPVVRPDLDGIMRRQLVLAMPCVTIPEGKALWVQLLPLGHTFYLEDPELLAEAVGREASRLVSARELSPVEFLRLFPAQVTALQHVEISVSRFERGDGERLVQHRQALSKARREEADRRLLGEIGEGLSWGHWSPRRLWPMVGRARELRLLERLLGGKQRLSAMVVGPPLSGKSRLILAVAAQRLGRPIVATSGAQLVAGQSGFGQWQERLHRVMLAAERLGVILYFDNLADLFAGQTGGMMDLAGAMRPYLEDQRVSIIGELSEEDAATYEHRQVGFFTNLHRVQISALTPAQTVEALDGWMRHDIEHKQAHPRLAEGVAPLLVELAERYMPYRAFPGKAVRLVEELRAGLASSHVEVSEGGQHRVARITAAHVVEAISAQTGIPAFLLREDVALRRDALMDELGRRVIAQREAVRRVAEVICVVKARLQPPARPLASFLFVGPTGVGKTEVARTLARALFGDADRLVRLDMSEYMDSLAAERLVHGSDRDEGVLTRAVRQQPFSVVLLDEIEKAHPAVFDLLLQVLGEGRLTDARGRTTSFQSALVIMTSNLGATHRRGAMGFDQQSAAATDHQFYTDQVHQHFRPELVNRLDRVIPFHALSAPQIREVARVTVERLAEREGFVEQGVRLEVSPGALDALARGGYSPEYGARALRRHIDQHLTSPVAAMLARHAERARQAHVIARSLDEPPHELEGSARQLMSRAHGALQLTLARGQAASTRRELRDVASISTLRRACVRLMDLPTPRAVATERDYLLTQLNYGSRRDKKRRRRELELADEVAQRRRQREIGELQRRYHRLDAALKDVHARLDALAEIEELAIGAYFDGEDAGELYGDADDEYGRFITAALGLLTCQLKHTDGAWLLLRRAGQNPHAMAQWIGPLLTIAEARGWRFTFHLSRDELLPPVPSWPEGRAFGPPRSVEEVEDRLGEIFGASRDVLLCARGPLVGVHLAMEAGVHRWRYRRDDLLLLQIQLLANSARTFQPHEWRDRALRPPMLNSDEVRRKTPRRDWDLNEQRLSLPHLSIVETSVPEGFWQEQLDGITLRELLLCERTFGGVLSALRGPLDEPLPIEPDAI